MSSYQGYGHGWYGASSPQDQASSPSEYYGGYYQSQPLVRDLSSGASSQASTVPESPMQRNSFALYGSSPTNYSGYQQAPDYQQYYSSGQVRAEEPSVPRSEPYVQPHCLIPISSALTLVQLVVTTGQCPVFTLAVPLALSSGLRIFNVTTRTPMLLSRARTFTYVTTLDALDTMSPSTVGTTFETIFASTIVKTFRSAEQPSTRLGYRIDMRPLAGGVAHAALFGSTSPRTALNALDVRHLASLSERRSVAADPEVCEQEHSLAHETANHKTPQSLAFDGLKLQCYSFENTYRTRPFTPRLFALCRLSTCRLSLLLIAHRHEIPSGINPASTAVALAAAFVYILLHRG